MTRLARIGVVISLLLLFIAAVGLWPPGDPLEQHPDLRLLPPGGEHPMGTDQFGRDQLTRVLVGTRQSLVTALASVGTATVIGVTLGALMAWYGGVVDLLLGRVIDLLLGIPYLVFCIVLVVAMTPSATSLTVALATVFTPRVARMTRSAFLTLLGSRFVEAAKLSGAPPAAIVLSHLLPNAAAPVFTQVSGLFATAIITETSMSFLGLGVPPPAPSLGRMLREGAGFYLEAAPWLSIFPGIAIAAIVALLLFASDQGDPARKSVGSFRLPGRRP